MLLTPAKYILAIGMTDDTSLDETKSGIFFTPCFFSKLTSQSKQITLQLRKTDLLRVLPIWRGDFT